MVPHLLKKRRPLGLVVVASIAAVAGSLFAAPAAIGATIADWTFETSNPLTAGPFAPEVGSGTASGSHAGAAAYSAPAGNGSVHSFSSNVWAVGDYYQFQVSTAGFTGIQLAFDQTGSATGPRDFQLSYSLNGTSFTNIGSAYQVLLNGAPNTAWSSSGSVQAAYNFAPDLSSATGIDNAVAVYFRLTDASGTAINSSPVGAGGTDRVDNVIISGTAAVSPVPLPGIVPATFAGLGLAGVSAFVKRRRLA